MGMHKQMWMVWISVCTILLLGLGTVGAAPLPVPSGASDSPVVPVDALAWAETLRHSLAEQANGDDDEEEDDINELAGADKVNSDRVTDSAAAAAGKNPSKKKKNKKQKRPPAPIVIEAEKLYYNDENGGVEAQGNVRINQRGQYLQAEHIHGNAQLGDFWVKEQMTFIDADNKTNMTGSDVFYNVLMKTGTMEKAAGKVDRQIMSGRKFDFFPERFTLHDANTTGCPAKVPDYHISADRMEIWPGDQMIAYNAKFWIKDTMIFSMAKYRKSLKKAEEGEPDFPQISYNNRDGLGVVQHLEYPVTDDISLFADLGYFTKQKFKPAFGAVYRTLDYSFTVSQGNFRDTDNNWLKKEPEYKFYWYPHRIGDSPVSYTFTAIYGKWSDDVKTSWHQDYVLYFARDPIPLDTGLNLYLGMGVERIKESYNKSTQDIFKYDLTLTKAWTQRFNSYVAYHYSRNQTALFSYSSDTPNRELAFGGSYSIDRMNAVGVAASYDMANQRLADLDYTWYRNLHCWQASLTYRSKRNEWKWNLGVTRW